MVLNHFRITKQSNQYLLNIQHNLIISECDESLIDQLHDAFGCCIKQLQDFTPTLKTRNEQIRLNHIEPPLKVIKRGNNYVLGIDHKLVKLECNEILIEQLYNAIGDCILISKKLKN